MSKKSNDELTKVRVESLGERYKRVLSALNEKERDLEENIEDLKEKIVLRRFEEEIKAKQNTIAQLAVEKHELERKLKEPENKLMLEEDTIKQLEDPTMLPSSDSSSIKKAIKECWHAVTKGKV